LISVINMVMTSWFIPLCLSGVAGHSPVKIISHGGDCDHSQWAPNHYGAWGWELAGQGLASDRRDGTSNFAAFHQPASDCRNNNYFLMDEQSPGVYKIVQHGGDCDDSQWAPNHYGMTGWNLVVQNVHDRNDVRDSGSDYAAFHQPDPDCSNNDFFRLEEQSPGVYKIISQGGSCDGSSYENHYGTEGWELAVQGALGTDHRDSSSAYAFFIAPASDCRNNNHFAIVPVDLYEDPGSSEQMTTQVASHNSKALQASTYAMLAAGLTASVAVGVALWRPCHKRSSGTLPLLAD